MNNLPNKKKIHIALGSQTHTYVHTVGSERGCVEGWLWGHWAWTLQSLSFTRFPREGWGTIPVVIVLVFLGVLQSYCTYINAISDFKTSPRFKTYLPPAKKTNKF